MILSNVSIQEALDKGWLAIDPRPMPLRPTPESPDCPYQTSAVDLRLGNEVSYFKEGLAINIDLRRGAFARLFGPNSESRIITAEQPYSLAPGKMVLGKTLETVHLPIRADSNVPCLAARVSRAEVPTPDVACLFILRHQPYTPTTRAPLRWN